MIKKNKNKKVSFESMADFLSVLSLGKYAKQNYE